ncbi:phosphatase PAP2 family protein [Micromonospora sp. U56]|uniref:phosphatase PAP2 family protein n=1 Tax=Micromonospora sp. U56 TaxID=2824900 RepID=UPI001B382D67|nr:phosphatase PAP2 family protein [Micromonospora sp. U56]MBQ0896804.1 phosphatase PAP2 family protein [Micromonospora sp. U56]
MAVVTDPQPPAPTGPTVSADGGRRRVIAMAVWGAAFVVAWLAIGLPTDPAYAFVWIWAATIAWNSSRPWRSHLHFARDWVPVVLLLAAYNLSRGFADNGATPHAYELIVADRVMFGWATGGEVPTVWLQEHLYRPDVQWWDVLASWVYFSHFVVALAAAAVLWLRDRGRWAAFMRRWGFLCATGLVTYFLYPAAPPWWAAQNGLLTEVARISTRGWKAFGMHGAGNLLNAGQIASNPVAAMPSLHTAFALFVVLFFLRATRKRWWPLLLAYPLAMTFTLVYCGEHYVIDVLVGWAYVGMTFLVVGLAERWWAAHRARRPLAAPPTTASPAVVSSATAEPVAAGSVAAKSVAVESAVAEPAGASAGQPAEQRAAR